MGINVVVAIVATIKVVCHYMCLWSWPGFLWAPWRAQLLVFVAAMAAVIKIVAAGRARVHGSGRKYQCGRWHGPWPPKSFQL